MPSPYEELLRIVDGNTPMELRIVAMRGFAEELNWTPSYEFQASFGIDSANDHLVVEHGLENSAIISFVRSPYRAADLDSSQLRALLAISYNNLIEWHIFVSGTDIRQINNLAEPTREPDADRLFPLTPSDVLDRLSATEVDLLAAQTFSRTLRACDDALIQVIARWKRLLKADYPATDNVNLSALFNAIIFVRGCEDRRLDQNQRHERTLLSTVNSQPGPNVDLPRALTAALVSTGVGRPLGQYVDCDQLTPFVEIDKATALNLCTDFYAPREAYYDFNFALMSKHALSRIYERYVALLRPDSTSDLEQLSFINPTPIAETPRRTGAVYTPQFVAGFFSRYVRDNLTPRKFRHLKVLDPACGSGIFLRTLLELHCNPMVPGTTPSTIASAFRNSYGIDRDPNAVQATRLSLALLHLAATGELPDQLQVQVADSIEEAFEKTLDPPLYGAVITNPPYIKLDYLPAKDREMYSSYLGQEASSRLDAYIPFIKLCLEAAEPGGFICMVLPQAFLTALNAAPFRKLIPQEFDIRCLVDLSAVPVFEGVGAYNILLILQRRQDTAERRVPAQVAQVSGFVGSALQACLDGRSVDSPYHRVYNVNQSFFTREQWILVSPDYMAVDERLAKLPRLSDYLSVVQGFVTGADDVFIIPRDQIPKGENSVYLSYLPDKLIGRYHIPTKTKEAVFYPYEGTALLDEATLKARYPETWRYLSKHRRKLEARGPVRAGKTPWWKPERPREPATIRRPKIICPHLMLTPRFAVDAQGVFAVSRSPFMIALDKDTEAQLLAFFVAVLNSSVCNWYIRNYAPKYAHGYSRLEANLLRSVPVPEVGKVSPGDLSRVLKSVEKLQSAKTDSELDMQTDALIADLYGFAGSERRRILGLDE